MAAALEFLFHLDSIWDWGGSLTKEGRRRVLGTNAAQYPRIISLFLHYKVFNLFPSGNSSQRYLWVGYLKKNRLIRQEAFL